MVSTIIRDYDIEATVLGVSVYAIFDTTTKTLLEEDLDGKFDREKHLIRAQVSINSKGKRFIAMWFEKKK
jgi:hypothetical protein